MLGRLLARLLRRGEQVHVLLRYEAGGTATLGPMSRFAAEVLIVNRVSPHPYWEGRRVASARIVA